MSSYHNFKYFTLLWVLLSSFSTFDITHVKRFSLHTLNSLANATESDKRDLMKELETMKQLKPHPHVIRLLGCVTESGMFW